MTRTTNLTTQVGIAPSPSQHELDKFWDWIEGKPATDEMWRLEADGGMVLVVDENTLVKILSDDATKAYEDFDAYEEHNQEFRAYEWVDLPYRLCGTYTIKGVYNEDQRLVNGERTYFFSQEF